MHKHLVLLSLGIAFMMGCESNNTTRNQSEVIDPVQELKLDSIRSVVTLIIDEGEALEDARSNIASGSYKMDENQVIRSIRFSLIDLTIAEGIKQLSVDMINLEEWDSLQQSVPIVDSAFMLNHISHLALSKITLGNITNELLLPVQINQDSVQSYIEGKTTLTLEDWGFDLPEQHKLHLGLSLYTLSEN